jgi:hypothetical protein
MKSIVFFLQVFKRVRQRLIRLSLENKALKVQVKLLIESMNHRKH